MSLKEKKGIVSIAVLLIITALGVIIGTSSAIIAITSQEIAQNTIQSVKSFYAGEAGVEDAVYRISKQVPYVPSYTMTVETSQATVTITSSGAVRTVQSQGQYKNTTKQIQSSVQLANAGAQFFYGAQVGEGGVTMQENSRIEGTGGSPGNIYSNGSIAGDNGATITGDAIVATGISPDNQAQQTVCNTDQIFGQNDPIIDMAQSFKPSESKPLAKVSLYIKKFGNPGDRTIRIASDANGSPAENSLANATLSSSLVTTSYGWIDITFLAPASLTANTTYWIIFDADKDNNKYWSWCKDSGAGYANGIGKYSKDWSDDPWTAIPGDLAFKTYLGAGASSIDTVTILGSARANTITNSKICGNAYYQTIDSSSLNFLNTPTSPTCPSPLTPGTGYPNQPDPAVQNMPISPANIDQWKIDAAAGGTINGNCGDNGVAGCVIGDNGTLSLGPKKITGTLILTKKQTLIVTGTLYLQGSISLDSENGATITCNASFGTNSCVILTDSWVHIKNNATFQGSGQAGSFLFVISTLQGCNGGTQQPQCTHHNGAIDLHNNATGAIFYTTDSLANLHNGVTVSQITAYKLNLDNNAIVRYEQGLANTQFSSGPGGSFKVLDWKEI